MGELREWTAWYKANRSLLLGGDVVRVDLPEHGAFLRGVVTSDADHRVRPLLLSFRGAAPGASTPPPPASDARPG